MADILWSHLASEDVPFMARIMRMNRPDRNQRYFWSWQGEVSHNAAYCPTLAEAVRCITDATGIVPDIDWNLV